jgi:hypothetical protein
MDWGIPRLLVLVAACTSLCTPAKADDWVVTSHIGQTLELNDNPRQLPDSPGGAVGSLTNFSLNAINELPTLSFEFGTDLAWREFTGPGAESSLDGLQGEVDAGFKKRTKLTDYNLGGSWRREPAAVSELIDSGILAANTTRTSYFATGGLEHHLNSLNSLGLSAAGTFVEFSNENQGLVPYDDAVLSGAWIRNISPRTTFTTATTTQWYEADNLTDTQSWIQTMTGQIESQLTPRLSVLGRAGGGVIHTNEEWPTARGGTTDISDTSGQFVGAAELAYELRNSLFRFSASQDFAPSSLGEVQDATRVGFLFDHKINEQSGVGFAGEFFDRRPSTSAPGELNHRRAMILSATYRRELMRDWDMLLRYRFVTQDETTDFFVPFDDGSSVSNAFFVTVTRDLHLFR